MTKTHYRMYKSGKRWAIAGAVTGAMVLGAGNATAHADERSTTDPATSQVTTATATQRLADPTVTLTPTANSPVATTPAVETSNMMAAAELPTTAKSHEMAAEITDQSPVTETPATDTDLATQPNNVSNVTIPAVPTTPPSVVPETPSAPVVVSPESSAQTSATPRLAATSLVQSQLVQAPITAVRPKATNEIDKWMPNKALQQAILLALQKLDETDKNWESVADITQEDLLRLSAFDVSIDDQYDTYIDGKTPFSLEGLQYAKNLTWLSAAASLNLQSKNVGAIYGDVVDVSPLADLQKLTYLDLQGNRITDISPLSNLKNLKTLALLNNHIRDFSPLKGFKGSYFNKTGQVIVLDPLLVSKKDRTGHLQVQCKTITGEVVQLMPTDYLEEQLLVDFEPYMAYSHFYFTGGNSESDGKGGLYFKDIPDQKPGTAELPYEDDKTKAIVMADHYFLTGQYEEDFYVIQPYVLAPTAATVTVQYHDEKGNAIAKDQVLPTEVVGTAYTTKPLEITGYTLTGRPENAAGKYSATPITVTYVYTKNEVKPPVTPPAKQTTVTVHHQTAKGQTVAPDETYSGMVGTAYTTHPANPKGYKLVTTPTNATGTYGENDSDVTYIYAPVETGGGETPNPGNPGDGNHGGGETPNPGNPGDGNHGGGETPNPGNPGDGNHGGGETPNPGNPGDGNHGGGETPKPGNPGDGNHSGGETPNPGNPGDGNHGSGQTPAPSTPVVMKH
ncbi:MucBP domain-containing protein [Levilactobacillus enshiensis]|uniref:MucBP domain-containing protein n=1 Tax=Levilactobacillus enshiensis TaxID=2590213 RepID=UPI00117AA527|nr:MucBP domain-containing protein [Levilactobacillus enshiensis]